MKAIVHEEFGGPEVLHLSEVEEPHAGPGEIRVSVRAAGINPLDWKVRHGWFRETMSTTFPAIPGLEAAGVVDEVGEGVTEFAVGDEVAGWGKEAYAEYAVLTTAAVKPEGLDWSRAVAIPVAGEAALRVLGELAVGEGETLLIHGASGAVGSLTVQLAVGLGATVIGTASPDNHDYVRSLGGVPVTYGDGLVDRVRAAAPEGVDAVLDTTGRGVLPDSIALRGGTTDRIVTIADGKAAEFGVRFSGGGTSPADQRTGLADNLRRAAAGELQVRVARTYPLADAGEAQRLSEGGKARGKLVLVP